jgi:methylase of polypeptide subunit release factors
MTKAATFPIPEAGSSDACNWALLASILAVQTEPYRIQDVSDALEMENTSKALSVLPLDLKRRFEYWLKSVPGGRVQAIADLVRTYADSKEELFNYLADWLQTQESAKARGAIFTPKWLAQRLVGSATKHWRRLHVGIEPSLAADLSCGPGVFLAELGSELRNTNIVGVDDSAEYVALARLLTGRFSNVNVHCADTLLTLRAWGQLTLDAPLATVPSNGYDIIVGNPPYVRCQLLKSDYSDALRKLYPELTAGNFDLATLFLAHTLEALAPGGVAALVISSKFMSSRYGSEICRRLGNRARILEIMDFGDGQVFDGRTTYTCTLTFAKLPPNGSCKVLKFPPGLKWRGTACHASKAEPIEIPADRFKVVPWDISSGDHDEILQLMRRQPSPRLLDLFPSVSQGIRTGANQFFVVPTFIAAKLEQEVMLPYISGENIRRCQILESQRWLIWPYHFTAAGGVDAISEEVLEREYPLLASYLSGARDALNARSREPGAPWYTYSRSQNLDLAHRPKLLARELLPRSEFAADEDGKYAICSGYALLPPTRMPKYELRMWAAVMCTPTMEFQLRRASTQLHSGWFRILEHHLKGIHLPPFSNSDQSRALRIADRLHNSPDNEKLWDELDGIVSKAFGLSDVQSTQIKFYIAQHHSKSLPNALFANDEPSEAGSEEQASNVLTGNVALSLSPAEREKYLPVELPKYYPLHSDRETLHQAVTFVDNKSKPIHRWYNFTQGFSSELVTLLLTELGATTHSLVYDPFAGSGTTLLACKQIGIPSFGGEISPLLCWISRLKTSTWDLAHLRRVAQAVRDAVPCPKRETPSVFAPFFQQAFAPKILEQIWGWRDWIVEGFEPPIRDFLQLGLVSILEAVSQLRKHGSHYRFLNKADSIGLAKLNIPVISSDAEVKPLFLQQLNAMIADVDAVRFPDPTTPAEIFNIDSRHDIPENRITDTVITSPPYLNRNMYFAQQKAELVLLRFISDYEDYRTLVRKTFRSHVEGDLSPVAKSDIPEVQAIVERIQISENNNVKIPNMVCGYFDDLRNTLDALRRVQRPTAKSAFVVGNCRWGGVVVPVDHLLALLAERLGYRVDRIIVTRLKGNSPQQMRRYGKIPQRESIVMLSWSGEN